MFELAKIVGWLLSPLSLVLIGFGMALFLAWRGYHRISGGVGAMSMVALWIVSTPIVSHGLAYALERQFPATPVEQTPYSDAIVLLGGALGGAHPPERLNFDLGPGADRVWHAATLYKAGKAAWILVSAGSQPEDSGMQSEAEAIKSMLLTLGVPSGAIRLEERSRNTAENAKESLILAGMLAAKRVLLVTSAMHMPRALATFKVTFRETRIEIFPATTDVTALPDTLHPIGRWLPDAASLEMSTRALKEYLGLVGMALRDRTT